MSLLFMDGFDHYVTADIAKKWTSNTGGTISSAAGRRGGGGIFFSMGSANGVSKTLSAVASWVVGVAVKYTTFPTNNVTLLRFYDAGTAQCSLHVNPDGTLSVVRGTSTAVTGGTSVSALTLNTEYYIEMKVTIADSIGANSCKVRINGVDVITVATGQDLKSTANATANQIALMNAASSGSSGVVMDDCYICDSSGSTNNDFLGDCRVDTLYPTSDGSYGAFTPSSGSTHYSLVAENAPDTATYVSSSNPGDKDTYDFQNVAPVTGTIMGVQVNNAALKDDAGARSVANLVRSVSTDAQSATVALSTSQLIYSSIHETDPATSAPWTESGINAAEFGTTVAA